MTARHQVRGGPARGSRGVTERLDLKSLVRGVKWTPAYIGLLVYVFTITTYFLGLGTVGAGVALVGLLVQRERFRLPTFLRWFLAFIVWSAITLPFAPYKAPVWATETPTDLLIELCKLWLIAVVAVNGIRTRAQLRFFLLFFLVAYLLFPVRGTIFNYFIYGYSYKGRAVWNNEFENPNQLAVLTLLQLSIAVGVFSVERQRLIKTGTTAAMVLLPLVILLTQSRGAFIGTSLFLLVLLSRGRRRLQRLVGVAVIASVAIMVAPKGVWDRIAGLRKATDTENLQAVDPEGSAEERYEIWETSWKISFDHPVTGIGFGSYPWANWAYARRLGPRDTHSTYFNVLAETGLVGIVFYVAMLIAVLRPARRMSRRLLKLAPQDSQQLATLQAGLIGFLVAAIWGTFVTLSFLYVQLAIIWLATQLYAPPLQRVAVPAARGPRR